MSLWRMNLCGVYLAVMMPAVMVACKSVSSESQLNARKNPDDDSKRPADEGQGVPGYLADPRKIAIKRDGNSIEISAGRGNFVATTTHGGSACAWAVDANVLAQALSQGQVGESIVGTRLALFPVAADGSFHALIPDPFPLVVILSTVSCQVTDVTLALPGSAKQTAQAIIDARHDQAAQPLTAGTLKAAASAPSGSGANLGILSPNAAEKMVGCVITQPVCTLNPTYQGIALSGTFIDPYTPANSNRATCAQRPTQFTTYCGNPVGTVTTAVYTDSGGNQSTFSATTTGCMVTQAICTLHPTYLGTPLLGTFLDPYKPANSDPAVCAQRPAQFATYCGNPPGTLTTAVYTSSNGTRSFYQSYATACMITQIVCRQNPTYNGSALSGTFVDPFIPADSSQAACALRPQQYVQYCGNVAGTVTTAVYTDSSGVTSTFSATAP